VTGVFLFLSTSPNDHQSHINPSPAVPPLSSPNVYQSCDWCLPVPVHLSKRSPVTYQSLPCPAVPPLSSPNVYQSHDPLAFFPPLWTCSSICSSCVRDLSPPPPSLPPSLSPVPPRFPALPSPLGGTGGSAASCILFLCPLPSASQSIPPSLPSRPPNPVPLPSLPFSFSLFPVPKLGADMVPPPCSQSLWQLLFFPCFWYL
jgi:hypothetical protein